MFSQVTPTVLPVPRPSVGVVILCYLNLCSYHVLCPILTSQVNNKTSGVNPFKWLGNFLCSLLFQCSHNFIVSCSQSSELYCALSLKLSWTAFGPSAATLLLYLLLYSLLYSLLLASFKTQLDSMGGEELDSVGIQCSFSKGTVYTQAGLLCCLVTFLPLFPYDREYSSKWRHHQLCSQKRVIAFHGHFMPSSWQLVCLRVLFPSQFYFLGTIQNFVVCLLHQTARCNSLSMLLTAPLWWRVSRLDGMVRLGEGSSVK